MLVLSRRPSESIEFPELGITAPRDLKVLRSELLRQARLCEEIVAEATLPEKMTA